MLFRIYQKSTFTALWNTVCIIQGFSRGSRSCRTFYSMFLIGGEHYINGIGLIALILNRPIAFLLDLSKKGCYIIQFLTYKIPFLHESIKKVSHDSQIPWKPPYTRGIVPHCLRANLFNVPIRLRIKSYVFFLHQLIPFVGMFVSIKWSEVIVPIHATIHQTSKQRNRKHVNILPITPITQRSALVLSRALFFSFCFSPSSPNRNGGGKVRQKRPKILKTWQSILSTRLHQKSNTRVRSIWAHA